jgi:hypothetical protein
MRLSETKLQCTTVRPPTEWMPRPDRHGQHCSTSMSPNRGHTTLPKSIDTDIARPITRSSCIRLAPSRRAIRPLSARTNGSPNPGRPYRRVSRLDRVRLGLARVSHICSRAPGPVAADNCSLVASPTGSASRVLLICEGREALYPRPSGRRRHLETPRLFHPAREICRRIAAGSRRYESCFERDNLTAC